MCSCSFSCSYISSNSLIAVAVAVTEACTVAVNCLFAVSADVAFTVKRAVAVAVVDICPVSVKVLSSWIVAFTVQFARLIIVACAVVVAYKSNMYSSSCSCSLMFSCCCCCSCGGSYSGMCFSSVMSSSSFMCWELPVAVACAVAVEIFGACGYACVVAIACGVAFTVSVAVAFAVKDAWKVTCEISVSCSDAVTRVVAFAAAAAFKVADKQIWRVQFQRKKGVGGISKTKAVFGGGRTGHPSSTSDDCQESGVGNPAPAMVNSPESCPQSCRGPKAIRLALNILKKELQKSKANCGVFRGRRRLHDCRNGPTEEEVCHPWEGSRKQPLIVSLGV
ncbi:hypothetical protein M0804_014088 [Polistes exclamans]|nr:hypothetical protein M0804_014088 [Polistes exclamans]